MEFSGKQSIDKYLKGGTKIISSKNIPPRPKKGELMICQMCGQPIYPDQFSKNKRLMAMEFKWHVHSVCREMSFEYCDRDTPGLIAERKRAAESCTNEQW